MFNKDSMLQLADSPRYSDWQAKRMCKKEIIQTASRGAHATTVIDVQDNKKVIQWLRDLGFEVKIGEFFIDIFWHPEENS